MGQVAPVKLTAEEFLARIADGKTKFTDLGPYVVEGDVVLGFTNEMSTTKLGDIANEVELGFGVFLGTFTFARVTFRREFSFGYAQFKKPVHCGKATFKDLVRFLDATFDDEFHCGEAVFHGSHLMGSLTFRDPVFKGRFNCDHATFYKGVELNGKFFGDFNCDDATFLGQFDCHRAVVGKRFSCGTAKFKGGFTAMSGQFFQTFSAGKATFAWLDLSAAHFWGQVFFGQAVIEGKFTCPSHVKFEENVDLAEVQFKGVVHADDMVIAMMIVAYKLDVHLKHYDVERLLDPQGLKKRLGDSTERRRKAEASFLSVR